VAGPKEDVVFPLELLVDGGALGWLVCFVGRRAELDVPERKSCCLLLVLALAITDLTYSATVGRKGFFMIVLNLSRRS